MLEQTQPYHEVCGMGAWQAWALDDKLSFRDHHHHPEPLAMTTIRLYVYTLSPPSFHHREGRGPTRTNKTLPRPCRPWAVSRGIR